jgi:hypothetical protein
MITQVLPYLYYIGTSLLPSKGKQCYKSAIPAPVGPVLYGRYLVPVLEQIMKYKEGLFKYWYTITVVHM